MEPAVTIADSTRPGVAVAQPAVFYRIVALWALCEAFLGGVLHGLHLPGTGLFVGAASVLCISLLYYYGPSRAAIIKATILVILIKGMLSPHTPPGAYLAVFIQGCLGFLIFRSKATFKLSCLALGVVTQLQSALQRLVVMVVMFGADIYQVAHGFVNYVLKKAGMPGGAYVLLVVIAYLGVHALMGVLVGWFAGRLPAKLEKRQHELMKLPARDADARAFVGGASVPEKRKTFKHALLLFIGLLLFFGLYFQLTPDHVIYTIIVRALLIYIGWIVVLLPLLQFLISRWSHNKRSMLSDEISHILSVMPFVKQQVVYTWKNMPALPLLEKILAFPPLCLAAVLQLPDQD